MGRYEFRQRPDLRSRCFARWRARLGRVGRSTDVRRTSPTGEQLSCTDDHDRQKNIGPGARRARLRRSGRRQETSPARIRPRSARCALLRGTHRQSDIPEAVLLQHTAVVGKTGAGKTSTSKLLVEQAVAAGARVACGHPEVDWRAGLPSRSSAGRAGMWPCLPRPARRSASCSRPARCPLSIIDIAILSPGEVQRFSSTWHRPDPRRCGRGPCR